MALRKLERRNYDGKWPPMSIKYQNLHSFKEGLILLCQSILETRRTTHLHGSAHFTIPLNIASTLVFAPDNRFLSTFRIAGISLPSILPIRVTSLSKTFSSFSWNGSLGIPSTMVFIRGFIYLFNRWFLFRHDSSIFLLRYVTLSGSVLFLLHYQIQFFTLSFPFLFQLTNHFHWYC